MMFTIPRLRLTALIISALIGLLALALSLGADKTSAQSLLPFSVAAHPGVGAASTTPLAGASALSAGRTAGVLEAYARAPLSFEPRDQSSGEFFSRGQGYNLAINSQEVALTLRQTQRQHRATRREIITSREDEEPPQPPAQSLTLTMKLIGADPSSRGETLDPLPGKRNYLLGNDQSRWRSNVPTFAKLRYRAVYPGVDLVYYGAGQQLEYDFIIAPGADPRKIRLAFDGVKGMKIDDSGDLVLTTELGEVRQRRPIVYQETTGRRQEIAGKYALFENGQVGFEVGEYDASLPLVIDPVIVYSTLLGGNGFDSALFITTDAAGAVYVVGSTNSDDLPAGAGAQPGRADADPIACLNGCLDAFVLKLNPAGTGMVFATYLGGTRIDEGFGLAVGVDGSVYLTGWAESFDFPTTPGVIQPARGSGRDAFVARLSADGSRLIYSTYLGGRDSDRGFYIAVDPEGNAYVTGRTQSTNFPTARPFQAALGSEFDDLDGFVAKLNPYGTELIFSTYLGGGAEDICRALALDSDGNVYVTGSTVSADFPVTPGAYQIEIGGSDDVFVTKFNADGSSLAFSTFVGGLGGDAGYGLALDATRNVYGAGLSAGFGGYFTFPLVNPLQRDSQYFPFVFPGIDAIVFKLSAAGDKLLYSTYFGGSGDDDSTGAIAVDDKGRVYFSGATWSNDLPVTPNAPQPVFGGHQRDGYMAVIDPSRRGWEALLFSSYFGGAWNDIAQSTALDAQGIAYVAGLTFNGTPDPPNNFPLVNPLRGQGGAGDAFLVKVHLTAGNPNDNVAPSVTITNPSATGEYVANTPRIDLTGVASDNTGVTRVVWRNDRAEVDLPDHLARGTASGTDSWNVKGAYLAYGINRFTVTARDAAGNYNSAAVTVSYQPEYVISTFAGAVAPPTDRIFNDNGKPAISIAVAPHSLAVDAAGNVFYSEFQQGAVRKISPNGIVTTVAGSGEIGDSSGDGGPATQARLNGPRGLALDGAGNLYIATPPCVRKVTPDGIINNFAGSCALGQGPPGGDGGPATQARLGDPFGLAADGAGNVYIADYGHNRIRKVDRNGIITTVAGNGESGFSGDGGPATQARLNTPTAVAVDNQGNLLITDYSNHRVRRVTPNGVINTIAGGGSIYSHDSVPATQAALSTVRDVATDTAGNIYICDTFENVIRRIKPDGMMDSIAGRGGYGFSGDGGPAILARMAEPLGVATDRLGRIYVADGGRIRLLSPVSSSDTGSPSVTITSPAASFYSTSLPFITISGMASDQRGVVLVKWSNDRGGSGVASGVTYWAAPRIPLQNGRNRILVTAFDAAGNSGGAEIEVGLNLDTTPPSITIVRPAANNSFTTTEGAVTISGAASDANGVVEVTWESNRGGRGFAEGATSWLIEDLLLREGVNEITVAARDAAGNLGKRTTSVVYNPAFIISTVAGGGVPGELKTYDGYPATSVMLVLPRDVAVDAAGAVYIAERGLRKVTPGGVIMTIKSVEQFGDPLSVACDAAGNLYFSHGYAPGYIRKLTPGGEVVVVAGGGMSDPGDGGPAASANLSNPRALTFDAAGNLYFIEGNHRVRKVTPGGIITTIINKVICHVPDIGDGGPASAAGVCQPTGLATDGAGNLYIADPDIGRVRKVNAAGVITTVAGTGGIDIIIGSPAQLGDGKLATSVVLSEPAGVATDAAGNLYITEKKGSRIRRVNSAGIITTVAGLGGIGQRGDGGAATWAQLFWPERLVFDPAGNLFALERERIKRLAPFVTASRAVASVSAASFNGASLAAESIAAAFGTSLAAEVKVANSTPLPTALGGASVKVRDSAGGERLAPLFFVSPSQINFQIPAGAKNGLATVTVTDANGGAAAGVVMISPVAPGLFSANADGQGVAAAVALRIKADGSQSYDPIAEFNAAQNRFVARPIDLGPPSDQVFLILFGTGLRNRSALSTVTAQIGGESAEVLFAGAQGGFIGLDQLNIRLPRSLAGRGDVEVTLTVDGKTANAVRINVK
ncbi:MAG: SBBP repeat-containing protein [Blastocatellales bacterium]